ncbi:hypothetical protein KIPB_001294 [Kipferlia bialata]|uniref:Suppressor of forked domain-containing protein n=1 Tax=Kipferlia bialata TaxID=797122 RepID=A0A9K3GE16_9EUKA|nr:hypothetical protein KIPB_001294 [Kipferlia bialata]|eukprot:g1294.t1
MTAETPAVRTLEDLQAALETNPYDLGSWDILLQNHADTSEDLEFVTKCYEDFLTVYPLCFYYWRRYANNLHRLSGEGAYEAALGVYLKGVALLPSLFDLWNELFAFLIKEEEGEGENVTAEVVLEHMEKGLCLAGNDWRAGPMWIKYIEYATKTGQEEIIMKAYQLASERVYASIVEVKTQFEAYVAQAVDANPMGASIIASFDHSIETATRVVEDEKRVATRTFFHPSPPDAPFVSAWRKYLTRESNPKAVVKAPVVAAPAPVEAPAPVPVQPPAGIVAGAPGEVAEEEAPAAEAEAEVEAEGDATMETEEAGEAEALAAALKERDQAWVQFLFERALVPLSKHTDFWYLYQAYLARVQGSEAAYATLSRSLPLHMHKVTLPAPYLLMSDAARSAGNQEDAEKWLRQGLEMCPKSADIRCALAAVLAPTNALEGLNIVKEGLETLPPSNRSHLAMVDSVTRISSTVAPDIS